MSATHRLPGLVLGDLAFRVPLDYAHPSGEQITVFARSATTVEKEGQELPWLVFFQGGPGFGSPRPEEATGWLKAALRHYRVLLLDQRGTGLSTPVTHQTLARLGDARAQADYLKHFRADNIVRDAEFIRRALIGEGNRWSVLGQSFGGFCVTRYLSAAAGGLAAAMFTGGLPPLTQSADEVYRCLYPRVAERNRRYYERYPEDIALVQEIVASLAAHPVRLPAGGVLTPRRFQQSGLVFGMSYGFERIHYLLEDAFVPGAGGRELSYVFLRAMENVSSFETNPIYALLHEPLYCQAQAANWSAERVRAEFPEFEPAPDRPVYFTGEMIYPWMFEDYAFLQPLREAAEILARDADWPGLYDPAVLGANTVPSAAAVYYDDMYVAREFSEEAARAIRGLKPWITNEYDHNGLRADGEHIFERLYGMVTGAL